MRLMLACLVLAAGCSSTGGGGYVHSDAATPADLAGTQSSSPDLASSDKLPDLATAGPPDFATSFPPDFSSPPDMAGRFGCFSDLKCYSTNKCMTDTCFTDCDNMVNTPDGFTILNDLFSCLDTACPSSGGGVCDTTAANYNATNCTNCSKTAQTGACISQVMACGNDG